MTGQLVDWWGFDLAVPGVLQRDLYALLSDDERERAGCLRERNHRWSWVTARGRLRQILAGYLDCGATDIRFSYTGKGKPLIEDAGLAFNLSHAGDRGIVAVTGCGHLGVDIEAVRPIPDMDRILGRFFSPAERTALQALPAAHRIAAFYRVWCRKEAVLKAVGAGLSGGLGSFSVAGPTGPAAAPVFHRPAPMDGPWQLIDLPGGPGYAAALAHAGATASIVPRHRHPEDGVRMSARNWLL